jgi:hypothetical protein
MGELLIQLDFIQIEAHFSVANMKFILLCLVFVEAGHRWRLVPQNSQAMCWVRHKDVKFDDSDTGQFSFTSIAKRTIDKRDKTVHAQIHHHSILVDTQVRNNYFVSSGVVRA